MRFFYRYKRLYKIPHERRTERPYLAKKNRTAETRQSWKRRIKMRNSKTRRKRRQMVGGRR